MVGDLSRAPELKTEGAGEIEHRAFTADEICAVFAVSKHQVLRPERRYDCEDWAAFSTLFPRPE